MRFGRVNARFQLNLSNVFDENTLVITNYNNYRVGNVASNPLLTAPSAYRHLDPRKLTLTAGFGF